MFLIMYCLNDKFDIILVRQISHIFQLTIIASLIIGKWGNLKSDISNISTFIVFDFVNQICVTWKPILGHKCINWELDSNMYDLNFPYGLIDSCIKLSYLYHVKLYGEDDDMVLAEREILMIPFRIEFHQYFLK